jgi:hypothetical protein
MKWKREGKHNEPRPGRPRLMTDRDRRALKKTVRETRQTSSETIAREFRSAPNCPARTMTVCRHLGGMGFHGRAAAHKPNISPVNTKRLLKWYKERRHWTVDNETCDLGWWITLYQAAVRREGLGVANAWRKIPASMCSANCEIWRRWH